MAFLSREKLEEMGFKKLGQNVLISDKSSIYRPNVIEIGDNVRVDDFCILSPGDDGIIIGNYIHIGCQSTLIGRGKITLCDFSNISSKVSIYSSNDDYSGEWMTNPMVPTQYTNVIDSPVFIGRHTIIGANSVILPGVNIGECCSIGSLSLVKYSIEDGWIVAGSPAKKIKKRSLRLKELENLLSPPILSVAISSYNFKDYIEECVHSITGQITNFRFEIVISDDFSQDGTAEILDRLADSDHRIRVIKSSSNLGAYVNIKKLHEVCLGKYISMIDGDDLFTDINKLQRQVDFLENNPEYVMHSAGYQYLNNDGTISPTNGWFSPLKEVVTQEDIIEKNIITFGRTYRNIPGLLQDWMINIQFLDWAVNFEILKYGKAKCESWLSGLYRITKTGMITSESEESIMDKNEYTSKILKDRFYKKEKVIAIVDSFVTNSNTEGELNKCLDRLNQDGIEILLVSNTKINPNILKKVNYFLYDERNQLFSDDYTGVRDVDLWKKTDQFEAHEVKPGIQKHGLSVLTNLFNSLKFAKSMGYTHFYRFEVDDDFGTESRKFIMSTPELVQKENKKGLFYFNEGPYHNGVNDTEPYNISFHFMFCEIDLFLDNIPTIRSEQDYREYLIKSKGNLNFEIAEEFIYNHISKIDPNSIIKKRGMIDMKVDFPDTRWNKVISESNTSTKFKGCTTMIYQVRQFPPGETSIGTPNQGIRINQMVIFSYNYTNQTKIRDIEVIFKNGNTDHIKQSLIDIGDWAYNTFGEDVYKIRVSENNEFLYEEYGDQTKNYIVFT